MGFFEELGRNWLCFGNPNPTPRCFSLFDRVKKIAYEQISRRAD
jgi:hypothetical protein